MAARATSSGTISFGLVSIPVKVYSAVQSKSLRFSMLHAEDGSRLKQQLVCQACGETVDRSDTVKGYEYSRGQYVVLTDDELKALERSSDKTIEIAEFIPIEKVDPIYFEKTNLLGPDKGGNKAYRLLHAAMVESGKVAVGRFATRGKQQLVLLRPLEHGLAMHGLYHADEVRSFGDIELGEDVTLKEGELTLANQLIEQLSVDDFEPENYPDEYRESALEVIDRKVAGEEIVLAEPAESREQIIDLVAALKESLSGSGAAAKAEADEAPAKRARKPARAKGAGKKKKAAKKKAASK